MVATRRSGASRLSALSSTRSRACGPTSKRQEFANYAADTIDDLARHARRGITRVRRRPRLLFAFFDRTGLSL
jgi:hypothetical protein